MTLRDSDGESTDHYVVVINEEEQYSIWPLHSPVPSGWRALEKSGTKEVCLEYIGQVWTDMRPRSLRVGNSGIHPVST